jgi:hypothetical protein
MKMSNRIRLKLVQKRLEAKGVVDVKFTWAPNVKDFISDEIAEDVVHMLEAYLDGRCTPAPLLGDSHGHC